MNGETDVGSQTSELIVDRAVTHHTKRNTDTPQCEPGASPLRILPLYPCHPSEVHLLLIMVLLVACYQSTRYRNSCVSGSLPDGLIVENPTCDALIPISDDTDQPSLEGKTEFPLKLQKTGVSPAHTPIVRTFTAPTRGGPLWRVLAATVKRTRPLAHRRRFMSLAGPMMATLDSLVDPARNRGAMTRKLVYAMARCAAQLGQEQCQTQDRSDPTLWPGQQRLQHRPRLERSLHGALRAFASLQRWHHAVNGGVFDSLCHFLDANRILSSHARESLGNQFKHNH